jgi:hypothetical protein
MESVSKKYVEREGITLKVQVYYELGGVSYSSGRMQARGYYLSVSPVEREQLENGIWMEKYMAFTGTKMLLNEVKRKSQKAENVALSRAEEQEEMLINHVLEANGVKVSC